MTELEEGGGGGDSLHSGPNQGRLRSGQMASTAKIKNDKLISSKARIYANSFLAAIASNLAEASSLGGELRGVMKEVPNPYSGHVQNIIVRKADHAFWSSCINELEDPAKANRICVTGTPGIGKSTSAFFAIRTLLVEMKKTVVYMCLTESRTRHYIVIQPAEVDGGFDVSFFPELTPDNKIDALLDPTNYFIVDAGRTKHIDCTPSGEVVAKVIVVAPPDERHWGGADFMRDDEIGTGGVLRYFPPWSFLQLKAGSTELYKKKVGRVADSFALFGGIPRYVYSPDKNSYNKRVLQRKLDTLPQQAVSKLLLEVAQKGDVQASFGHGQPLDGLVVVKPKNNFCDAEIEFASDAVVLRSLSGKPLPYMNYTTLCHQTFLQCKESSLAWQMTRHALMQSLLRTAKYSYKVPTLSQHDRGMYHHSQLELGGCTETRLRRAHMCAAAVRDGEDKVLVYPVTFTIPYYDMIYKIGTAFYAFKLVMKDSFVPPKCDKVKALADALGVGEDEGVELNLFYVTRAGLYTADFSPKLAFMLERVSIMILNFDVSCIDFGDVRIL